MEEPDVSSSEKKLKHRSNIFSFQKILKDRLDAAIESIELEIEFLKKTKTTEAMNEADKALAVAKANKQNTNIAWSYLQDAEMYMVPGMDDSLLNLKATQLSIETSEKLSGMRQKQIFAIIGTPEEIKKESPKKKFTAEEVMEAMRIRNEHYNTQFHRLTIRKINLRILASLLVIIIAAIVFTSLFTNFPQTKCFWQQALIVIEFGLLGGCLSMAYTITSAPVQTKIPEQLMGSYITVIRLAIGATASMISLLLFKSTLLKNIFATEFLESPYAYLIIAFLAGFSERWVVNIIDKATNESKKN